MPFLNDNAFDSGLSWVQSNLTRIDICSQEPTTYTEATSTYSLGSKTGLTTGAPQDGDVSGRKVVVPSFTDGAVSANGTASHWAGTDGVSVLAAAYSLAASQVVTSGNPFQLAALNLTLQDPA